MNYLINDLSRLTGVKGPTIRKWQERYKILKPTLANNGYWIYHDDDYLILNTIHKKVQEGIKVSEVVAEGRDALLATTASNREKFTRMELKQLRLIIDNKIMVLQRYLNQLEKTCSFPELIEDYIYPLIVLVGNAWEARLIHVSDEHSFSKWMFTYLYSKATRYIKEIPKNHLITVFPGDVHELGALMHFSLLAYQGGAVKFLGAIPFKFLLKELKKHDYETISFSMALPQSPTRITQIRSKVEEKLPECKVLFGGRGWQLTKQRYGEMI